MGIRFPYDPDEKTAAAPLAVFRILFGLIMFLSMVRFWANGWIERFYIEPTFFFSYYGFEWVKPLGSYTYLIFLICAVSAAMILLGYKYRLAIITFFLSFTYIELMDKTTYLNHYYLISLLSFLMIFLPAGACFSVDSGKRPLEFVPRWSIDSIKLLICLVYFHAGLAKLNSDWLVHAMPLKLWLPSKYDIPILGKFLHKEWAIYAFAWGGALYDLCIPFLLLWRRTRPAAFILVAAFHILTRVLFPIGMFPYIMIACALLFFSSSFHRKLLRLTGKLIRAPGEIFATGLQWSERNPRFADGRKAVFILFFLIQLMFPFRNLLYPGELFWTEEGFRFSWRVMLVEKAGYAAFKIVNPQTGRSFYVDNTDFLTAFQEKQMAFQPDFILQYAHHLADHFEARTNEEVEVYVESYVTLNGRRSRQLIDPAVNLAGQTGSLKPKTWILPFKDEIKGL